MKFQSIYNFIPQKAVISSDSEVKRDESLTISQIISLHLRGIPANVHVYDAVEYESGYSDYSDEIINTDYYEMENDLSDFNAFVNSSGDYTNNRRSNDPYSVSKVVENDQLVANQQLTSE